MRSSEIVSWIVAALGLLVSVPGNAQPCPTARSPVEDEAAARELFVSSQTVEPAEPERALSLLHCAERLAPRAAVALRIGTVAERLGHFSEAADAFERYLARAGADAPDATALRSRIAELRDKGGAQGAPEDAGPWPPEALAGWVVGSVGLALGLAGGVLLGVAHAHSNQVEDIEARTTLWESDDASGTYEQARTEQTVGIVGLVVGAAAAVLGVALIATAESDSEGSLSIGMQRFGSPFEQGGAIVVTF